MARSKKEFTSEAFLGVCRFNIMPAIALRPPVNTPKPTRTNPCRTADVRFWHPELETNRPPLKLHH
jgi:hypothetical protein